MNLRVTSPFGKKKWSYNADSKKTGIQWSDATHIDDFVMSFHMACSPTNLPVGQHTRQVPLDGVAIKLRLHSPADVSMLNLHRLSPLFWGQF